MKVSFLAPLVLGTFSMSISKATGHVVAEEDTRTNKDHGRTKQDRPRHHNEEGNNHLRTRSNEVVYAKIVEIKCLAASSAFGWDDFIQAAGIFAAAGCTIATAGTGAFLCAGGGAALAATSGLVAEGIDKGEPSWWDDEVYLEVDNNKILPIVSGEYLDMNSGDTENVERYNRHVMVDPSMRFCVKESDYFGDDELGCFMLGDLEGESGREDVYVESTDMGSMYRITFDVGV